VIDLSPDVLVTVLVALAIVVGIALALEPRLSTTLLRLRAERLPPDLAERLGEEWLAECKEIDTRAARLLFAVSLFLMSTKRLLGEGEPALVPSPEVVLSQDVQVTADMWSRLPALLLDLLISLPFALATRRWLPPPATAWMLFGQAAAAIAFTLVMNVALVQRFGGSPGKLLMKLRIVTVDGTALRLRHALLRIAPGIALALASLVATAWALLQVDVAAPGGISTIAAARALDAAIPAGVRWLIHAGREVWGFGDLLVYMCSLEHRAWHDLIAGTMVIHKVPKVVGTLDLSPPRPTSLMR
jgi:uncharacterized RDD family membrane protein YckC